MLGPSVLLAKKNNFRQLQHQTKPLCEHDGSRQKQEHSAIISEHRWKQEQCPNHKHQRLPHLPASVSDGCYFPSYGLSSIYFSPLIGISWWSWDLPYQVSISILERMLSPFSHVWLCVTLWTVAHQAPRSMEFSSQEHWSGQSCPPPGNLPNPGIKPTSLMPPTLAGDFTTSATWEAC